MLFTADETKIILDALDMALASNKRMNNSKPKFAMVFAQIEQDILNVKNKLLAPIATITPTITPNKQK